MTTAKSSKQVYVSSIDERKSSGSWKSAVDSNTQEDNKIARIIESSNNGKLV